jgi:hypothetical protein
MAVRSTLVLDSVRYLAWRKGLSEVFLTGSESFVFTGFLVYEQRRSVVASSRSTPCQGCNTKRPLSCLSQGIRSPLRVDQMVANAVQVVSEESQAGIAGVGGVTFVGTTIQSVVFQRVDVAFARVVLKPRSGPPVAVDDQVTTIPVWKTSCKVDLQQAAGTR